MANKLSSYATGISGENLKILETDGTDATKANVRVQLTGSNVNLGTASATGRQTAQNVAPGSVMRLNIWGTASAFDVQVQGQMYDGQWYTLPATNYITGVAVTGDITAVGIYDFDTGGFVQVALNVVSVTGGNVNSKGAFLP